MLTRDSVLREIHRVRRKLNSTRRLMSRIGTLVTVDSKRSFIRQRLGTIEWWQRYPGLRKPFINIAGALADFIAGHTDPAPSQFKDRPALIYTGALQRSIKSRVLDSTTVEVGSDKPYAALHQEGGTSEQTYGPDTQQRIHDWLFEKRETPGPRGGKYKPRQGREGYIKHLAPLLHKTTHVQNVIARPFIGVTDEAEAQIREAITQHFKRVR